MVEEFYILFKKHLARDAIKRKCKEYDFNYTIIKNLLDID